MAEDTSISESWSNTKHKKAKFAHKWTIDNFSFYLDTTDENDQPRIDSSSFSPKDHPNLDFSLVVFPKGENETNKNFAEIYLTFQKQVLNKTTNISIITQQKEVRLILTISIIDAGKNKLNTKSSSTRKFVSGFSLGWPKYISIADLKKNRQLYLPNDKLTIYCEVEAILGAVNTTNEADLKVESAVIDDLSVLLENTKLSDVILIANNKKEIKAHKAILAARSDVFAAMFEHDTLEMKSNRIDIVDIDADTISEMLRFIYTGRVQSLDKLASKLLTAADKYDLDQLKSICETALCASLTAESAVDLLVLADMHDASQLRTEAIEFINSNLSDIIETPNWKKIKNHPELYFELFSKLLIENMKK